MKNRHGLLIGAGLGVVMTLPMAIAFYLDSPTAAELQAAQENVATTCYTMCGPWYTWLITWMVAIGGVGLLVSVFYRAISSPKRA